MLIVQKYGGSSLSTPERIRAAAHRVAQSIRAGNQVIVVVSAQGDTTDGLITNAASVCTHRSLREMDAYLAVGEQMSAVLMAMALEELGCPAVSLTGWQAGIQTDSNYGNARIIGLQPKRLRRELESGKAVVVTGFQGINAEGDITTLGRGGSDTTAVALAAFMQAEQCKIFTDVDGVYDKDPRKHPDAIRFDRISYEHMLSLVKDGAQVLHDRSVEFAREYGIAVEVLSAVSGAPGTIVGPSE